MGFFLFLFYEGIVDVLKLGGGTFVWYYRDTHSSFLFAMVLFFCTRFPGRGFDGQTGLELRVVNGGMR